MPFEDSFVPGLERRVFLSDPMHALLAVDAWRDEGPNIGRRGEHLTITFLSLNRSSLSIRLLRSIGEHLPDFAGEVLVIDNGSSDNEKDILRAALSTQPYRTRMVELGRNFGVAGGRNRAMPHVSTPWVMCLDNDIYFVSDPLAEIQRDLAQLGCHFMSLPLLDSDGKKVFARGGHLYVSLADGELHVGAGSACMQSVPDSPAAPGFISSFLFGGACVFNAISFQRMGGYDEGMFVGFEDIDFSIRLFQQGMKIGSATTLALVHDHPAPDSSPDVEYEQRRFSRNVLRDSAMHLERKHGLKVWSDAVDRWLQSRHQDLGICESSASGDSPRDGAQILAPSVNRAARPRIGLVLDTDNWAFSNIAKQLRTHLSDAFEFEEVPMDVVSNIDHVLMMMKKCDLLHFFWREHLTLIGTPYYRGYVEQLGVPYAEFERHFLAKPVTTAVYDHLLLDASSIASRRHLYRDLICAYGVSSKRLFEIYRGIPDFAAPAALLEDGVDRSLFRPLGLQRFESLSQRDLVVGWVGNSAWAGEIEDFKGFHSILVPALKTLEDEGERFVARFADRQSGFIAHANMPDYYASIDVLVCVSKIEGTPNPVLEAMACGVPVISTDVGIVPDAFGRLQREFILRERSTVALVEALRRLRRDPALHSALSRENVEAVATWDWALKAKAFQPFFQGALDSGRVATIAATDATAS